MTSTLHDEMRQLPIRSLHDLDIDGRSIVVVAPHPDDESLGCGGLICQVAACATPLRLIFVSDGTGSHPHSQKYPADRLRRLRRAEAIKAAETLGVGPEALVFLDLPDQQVPVDGPVAAHAIRRIVMSIEEIRAHTLFVTWDQDPHCDHVAAYRLVKTAVSHTPNVKIFAYPTWAWINTRTGDVQRPLKGFRLPISAQLKRKRAAIMEYRSQTTDLINDDPTGFRLSDEFMDAMLQPYETYLET